MNNIDLLYFAIESKEGGMVAIQFKDWANGASFDNQNPNAMKRCHAVLERIAFGNNSLRDEARYWQGMLKQEIDKNYLEELEAIDNAWKS